MAFEEAVELQVVFVTVDDDAVGFVMAQEKLGHVGTVSQGTVEHPCQSRTF